MELQALTEITGDFGPTLQCFITLGVHYFFLGMGAVASTAAIGNVVTVEMTFEEWLSLSMQGG